MTGAGAPAVAFAGGAAAGTGAAGGGTDAAGGAAGGNELAAGEADGGSDGAACAEASLLTAIAATTNVPPRRVAPSNMVANQRLRGSECKTLTERSPGS